MLPAYHQRVNLDPTSCPDEEFVERYIMHSLPDAENTLFEAHCRNCAVCRVAVEETDAFVRAIQEAEAERERSR